MRQSYLLTSRLLWSRSARKLDAELNWATIESLPVQFAVEFNEAHIQENS
jgi:hypothetical protein